MMRARPGSVGGATGRIDARAAHYHVQGAEDRGAVNGDLRVGALVSPLAGVLDSPKPRGQIAETSHFCSLACLEV